MSLEGAADSGTATFMGMISNANVFERKIMSVTVITLVISSAKDMPSSIMRSLAAASSSTVTCWSTSAYENWNWKETRVQV